MSHVTASLVKYETRHKKHPAFRRNDDVALKLILAM